ncbi:hypothetical protein MASR2M18_19760 [Ignavibacteria bacterium]|nr:hypothetical protein [Bacteroidota bacterium]MCZ2131629.1 hypothetical protein [Bacteroidota bacterium]
MITEEFIESVAMEMAQLDQDEAEALIAEFQTEQPAVFNVVISVPEEFTDEEAEIQLYLGLLIWKTMKTYCKLQSNGNLQSEVTEEKIAQTVQKNISLLQQIDEDSEGDALAFVERIMDDYPQQELLRYVLETLVSYDDEEYDAENILEVREDMKGFVLLTIKTAIDCLDAA